MSPTLIVFWGFAGLAIASALFCITRKNPVASALWLVVTLFSLAALFVILDAQFIAVLQVLVYAGAIMVLFLFVIMLLNLGRRGPADLKGPAGLAVGVALGVVLLFQLLAPARAADDPQRQCEALGQAAPLACLGLPDSVLAAMPQDAMARLQEQEGMVGAVARPLFQTYLLPFEITSVLLLAAIVGAVVLAKRKL
ncbi:MAG TPA: NADH-quinone oxidoreductase subunit J [Gemmatimonadales bacterium]|nr:NADH-quinone oxidoreductase subunit J [Gemmatimonadales bacterium]